MRTLIIDGDDRVSRALRLALERDGLEVDVADRVEVGRMMAMANRYDAIVLDLGLPDGDGTTLIRRLRAEGLDTPIAVLTGVADDRAAILALDAGADDVLTKPVAADVFRARIRALMRRSGGSRQVPLSAGNLVLNRRTHEVLVAGKPLSLTSRDTALLENLLLRRDSVVRRSELLTKVLGLAFDPGTNVLDVAVSRLRKKLDAAGATVEILSRRGMGFSLSASAPPPDDDPAERV